MPQNTVNLDRYKYLGGSDIPVIMNLSPFKTRWQLLQEKARITEDTFEGNVYTEYGNKLEPKIRTFINIKTDSAFLEGKHYLTFENVPVRIHTDGEDKRNATVLEIKTTSYFYSNLTNYKVYLVQLLFYMMMLNYTKGILAVYERPSDFSEIFDEARLRTFDVFLGEFSDLCSEIEKAIQLFYIDLEKLKENPFLTQTDLLTDDISALARRLVDLSEQEKKLKEISIEKKDIETKLLEEMTKNGKKTFDGFGYKITSILPNNGKEVEEIDFDMDAFKTENPEMFAKYCKEIRKVIKGQRSGSVKLTRLKDD